MVLGSIPSSAATSSGGAVVDQVTLEARPGDLIRPLRGPSPSPGWRPPGACNHPRRIGRFGGDRLGGLVRPALLVLVDGALVAEVVGDRVDRHPKEPGANRPRPLSSWNEGRAAQKGGEDVADDDADIVGGTPRPWT